MLSIARIDLVSVVGDTIVEHIQGLGSEFF